MEHGGVTTLKLTGEEFHGPMGGGNHVMTYPLNLQEKSFMEHEGENPAMTCP